MESLIANDWLKDYGPLFDMFDEEMRAGQVDPSDYLNEYDLNNYYNANYKQTDELSLILGLEWMPNLEINSPDSTSSNSISPGSSSSSSSLSSSVPSPAAADVAPTPTVVAPCQTQSSVTVKRPAISSCTQSAPTSTPNTTATLLSPATPNKQIKCVSLKDTAPKMNSQNSNSSCSSPSLGSTIKRRKKCPRMKGTSLLAQPAACASPLRLAGSTSSSSSSCSNSSGNSVLQSSSGNNIISPTTIISPITTPLSTLVTFSNNTNRLATTTTPMATATTIPSSLTVHNLNSLASSKTISTITNTNNNNNNNITTTSTNNNNLFSPKHLNLITNSGKQPLLQLQQKQHHLQQQQSQPHHQQQPLIFLSTTRTNLTTQDKAVRYCVKIEHAYSLS